MPQGAFSEPLGGVSGGLGFLLELLGNVLGASCGPLGSLGVFELSFRLSFKLSHKLSFKLSFKLCLNHSFETFLQASFQLCFSLANSRHPQTQ